MIGCCGFSWDQGLVSPSPRQLGVIKNVAENIPFPVQWLASCKALCSDAHLGLVWWGGLGWQQGPGPCLGQDSTQGSP